MNVSLEIIKIIGAGFITALVSILLKQTKPELSFAVTATGVIIILVFIVDMLQNTVGALGDLAVMTGINNTLLRVLLKVVGLGYLTEFCAGILQDFGSPSMADKVVLGGKVGIVLLSFPIFESLITLIRGFLELM